MAASYTDNPSNMPDIIQYIILDKSRCVQEIIMAEKCFFYDTCAFRRHANLQHPEPLFEFLKGKNGIVVITRTIIMELASASKSLNADDTPRADMYLPERLLAMSLIFLAGGTALCLLFALTRTLWMILAGIGF